MTILLSGLPRSHFVRENNRCTPPNKYLLYTIHYARQCEPSHLLSILSPHNSLIAGLFGFLLVLLELLSELLFLLLVDLQESHLFRGTQWGHQELENLARHGRKLIKILRCFCILVLLVVVREERVWEKVKINIHSKIDVIKKYVNHKKTGENLLMSENLHASFQIKWSISLIDVTCYFSRCDLLFFISLCLPWSCNEQNTTIVFPAAHKSNQKGWREVSGNPFFYIISYEKTGCREGGESKVSVHPKYLAFSTHF